MMRTPASNTAVKFGSKKNAKWINAIVKYTLMTLIAVVLLFPYFYMVVNSLKSVEEIENPTLGFFPKVPQFKNYVKVFGTGGYGKGIITTMEIIIFNLVAVPVSASLIAYSFVKLRWWGRNFMFAFMLCTMMLPSAVTQLPLYVIFTKIGFLDTILPFTVPNLFGGGAMYIFLICQFMRGIPNELENAAKIDGANTFVRYSRIVFPLCKPIFIYIMVQVFLAYWGDYYGPMVYSSGPGGIKTVALVLYNFVTDNSTGERTNVLMAGAVFMSLVPTLLFSVFQKQLIEGVTMTGLKG